MKLSGRRLKRMIREVLQTNMALMGLEVIYQGIVKAILPPALIDHVKSFELPLNAIRLNDANLHVTLLHQSAFKDPALRPHRKTLKKSVLNRYNGPMQFLPTVINRKDPVLNRESWVLYVDEATQEALEDYVLSMIESLAPGQGQLIVDTYDAGRRFHVSLANLTGNTNDSVRQ